MIKPEPPPICKPLLHHMRAPLPPSSLELPPDNVDAVACHLHDLNICPVHGIFGSEKQSLTPPIFEPKTQARVSIACSANIASPTGYDKDGASQFERGFPSIDVSRMGGYEEGYERDEQKGGLWPEGDLKKACEKLCEQMQWKSEKHHQEAVRSSFREIKHCQASLRALHKDNINRSRGDPKENNGHHVPLRSSNRSILSLSQSHSPFSDATFSRPFQECRKERPMSVPIHEWMRRIGLPGQSLVPDDLLQRYSVENLVWTPQSTKGGCIGSRGAKLKEDVVVSLHPSPPLRNIDHFRSKSAELKKPWFCTGINCGKRETMPKDAAKKMLKVLPVIVLHRDKAKSMWNRKVNQKEWDATHRGCCSQHWVSLLNKNEKVCHTNVQKVSVRANYSPTSTSKFTEMTMQKLQVQGERCCLQVERSLDLSSSPLSSLKAIVTDINRPQSASLPERINNITPTVIIPRSSVTCRSSQDPSIVVPPTRKLKNPELNSSTWLLAKMEALKNETFTEPKALQIAKEHGIMLDKEDEAALKKFLQSEESSSPERQRNKPREKYFNLCNISTPIESSMAAMRSNLIPKHVL